MEKTVHMNIPIAYFLLQERKEETYETAFNMFKLMIKTTIRANTNYITDFEKAEINADKKCFFQPGDSLQLCYFHFIQSMTRFFHKLPKTKISGELNKIVKMFPFISEEKSIEIIEEFERFDETKHFISYFVLSYLNRYNFKDKNVSTKSSKETITKHVVESHNNILRKAMYLNI